MRKKIYDGQTGNGPSLTFDANLGLNKTFHISGNLGGGTLLLAAGPTAAEAMTVYQKDPTAGAGRGAPGPDTTVQWLGVQFTATGVYTVQFQLYGVGVMTAVGTTTPDFDVWVFSS